MVSLHHCSVRNQLLVELRLLLSGNDEKSMNTHFFLQKWKSICALKEPLEINNNIFSKLSLRYLTHRLDHERQVWCQILRAYSVKFSGQFPKLKNFERALYNKLHTCSQFDLMCVQIEIFEIIFGIIKFILSAILPAIVHQLCINWTCIICTTCIIHFIRNFPRKIKSVLPCEMWILFGISVLCLI